MERSGPSGQGEKGSFGHGRPGPVCPGAGATPLVIAPSLTPSLSLSVSSTPKGPGPSSSTYHTVYPQFKQSEHYILQSIIFTCMKTPTPLPTCMVTHVPTTALQLSLFSSHPIATRSCWTAGTKTQKERPRFVELVEKLGDLLQANVQQVTLSRLSEGQLPLMLVKGCLTCCYLVAIQG